MRKKLLTTLLFSGIFIFLFSSFALAYETTHSVVNNDEQAVDVVVTADDTYGGSISDFTTALTNALNDLDLTSDDVRINAVQTDISLSNFDDWYVYDHYYNPDYDEEGATPDDWNDYSGRHPYYYWKETSFGVPAAVLAEVEEILHNQLWADYQFMIYSGGTYIYYLYDIVVSEYPYAELTGDDKADMDAAIIDELTEFWSYYDLAEFTNYDEYLIALQDFFAEYYFDKTYAELTDEEKANLASDIDYYHNEWPYSDEVYGKIVFASLSSDAQEALADDYLIDNTVKPNYDSENGEGTYAALTTEEQDALLQAYKNEQYDDWFSDYMNEGESFADDSMTEERKAEVIEDYYYLYYITYDGDSEAYWDMVQYAGSHLEDEMFVTDITSPDTFDGTIFLRDKHIYTSIDDENNASITFMGYSEPAYKDFLIYPTTMANEKTVNFDIDASMVSTHTLEGAGFLINAGIDEDGYIHGYVLFYRFSNTTSGTVYLYKINDGVLAEDFHNSEDDYISDFATEIASQSFSINTDSMMKNINVIITPNSLICEERDYDAEGNLGSASELFTAYYDIDEDYLDLDTMAYNGFGPIVSYYSHGCEELSAFTFSNLEMSYESSAVESLRNSNYIEGAKKVYIVLTGNEETDDHDDLASYYELLARLINDQVFYVTTGGDITITANGGNGLDLSDSASLEDAVANVAAYIADLGSGTTTWQAATIPNGAGIPPVAIFDITDTEGNQIMSVDQKHIDGSLVLTFGNVDKSASLDPDGDDLNYDYVVYDPTGNALDLSGEGGNELEIDSTFDSGIYTFELTVSDGIQDSVAATRTLILTGDSVAPTVTRVGSTATPHTSSILNLDISDSNSGVAAYAIGIKTAEAAEATYDDEVVLDEPTAEEEITLDLDKGEYTVYVKAYDACGNERIWTLAVNITESTHHNNDEDNTDGAPVIVNGDEQNAGTSEDSMQDGKTVTTVTVDDDKLNDILEQEGNGANVIIPILDSDSDIKAGILTGQMVKNMEDKESTLEIKTDSASYTLPASEINIDAVSEQFGEDVNLEDIEVEIQIAEPSDNTTQVVANAASEGEFTIVVPAVEFTISCTYDGETVELESFNSYVERTVAIPDGVDPSKITTGIVVDPDGTIHHVPTKIILVDGKYYAVINSLTNSTYTVIYNPIEFADVANHWAKDAINDMGSRMIITGVGDNKFAPNKDITRSEFAAIMVRALGLEPDAGSSNFADVKTTDWYCGYIQTAAEYDIITGYSNGNFGPNDKITREQAMAIIARAMEITDLESTLTDSEISSLLAAYSDSASASAYAKASIAACLDTGVVTGQSASTVAPKAYITRAEVAVIVQRLLQKSDLIN